MKEVFQQKFGDHVCIDEVLFRIGASQGACYVEIENGLDKSLK